MPEPLFRKKNEERMRLTKEMEEKLVARKDGVIILTDSEKPALIRKKEELAQSVPKIAKKKA